MQRIGAGGPAAILFDFCGPVRKKENSLVILDLVILEKKVAGVNEAALERFVLRARKAVGLSGQVNVLVTSSAALRLLNQRFRGQSKATDVLSFPASAQQNRTSKTLAGEVAISADIALKNSFRLGHAAIDEVKILALHGVLHLAGFDHERDNGEMARKEAKLRHALGLPFGLIERTESAPVTIGRSSPAPSRQRSKPRRSAASRRTA
jgi:probable rRNA maturation factor